MVAGPYGDWKVIERNTTLWVMRRVGAEAVRGGKWCWVDWRDRYVTKSYVPGDETAYPTKRDLESIDPEYLPAELPAHLVMTGPGDRSSGAGSGVLGWEK